MASTTTPAQPGQELKDAAQRREAERKTAEAERSARRRAEAKKPAKKKAAPAKRATTKKVPASHTKGTCPTCGARSGQVCTYPRGVERKRPHRTRGK